MAPLHPFDNPRAAAMFQQGFQGHAAFQVAAKTYVRCTARLTRTIASGREYDATLDLIQDRRGAEGFVELRIDSQGSRPLLVRGELVGSRVDAITVVATDSQQVVAQYDGIDLSRELELPLALGDLQLADVIGFMGGVQQGRVQVLGTFGGDRSRRMTVVEVAFPELAPAAGADTAAATPGADDFTGKGASALVYIDAQTLVPRTIRVFDRQERLVRIYDGIVLTQGDGGSRLQSFRVTARPTGSNSIFRIDRLEIE